LVAVTPSLVLMPYIMVISGELQSIACVNMVAKRGIIGIDRARAVALLFAVAILSAMIPISSGLGLLGITSDDHSLADHLERDVHRTSVAPLAESEKLRRGMNMLSYASREGFWFQLDNGSLVWENIEPYWLRIGFNPETLEADLNSLQVMGVRYVRSSALIFQFMNWDESDGYTGLNSSAIANFDVFLEELGRRGMLLTPTLISPAWTPVEHPSLMQYYRVFNSSTGMSPGALDGICDAMVDFSQHYWSSDVIYSWDLVGGFSEFIALLTNSTGGFGFDVNPVAMFDFIEDAADQIRAVDTEHKVTMTDEWPWNFDEESWNAGEVPPLYNESLINLVDYVSVSLFSEDPTLPGIRLMQKPFVLSEVASSRVFDIDRETSSRMIIDTYAEVINKSYSGFAPWEFSRTSVLHEPADPLESDSIHDWTWDALLLFSLYRSDAPDFVSTSDYRLLSSEPEIDTHGHVALDFFLPEGIGGTNLTLQVVSENLIMATSKAVNSPLNIIQQVYGHEELDTMVTGRILAEVQGAGQLTETGIQVENCSSWTASVSRYKSRQLHFTLNALSEADIVVENGLFGLVERRNYRVVITDLVEGGTTESVAEATSNLELHFVAAEGAHLIMVTPLVDLLNMLSIGASATVVLLSLVVYCYADRRDKKTIVSTPH
jgi:hypothetical protein